MNEADSTNGICDECKLPLKQCECNIACQKCEDLLPRRHPCDKESAVCEYCDEPKDQCSCQPSGHYD